MSKKITAVVLAALMLLVVALPANAALTATTVEIRGTVANATALYNGSVNTTGVSWNATSFAGFWYDLKDNKQTETLQINSFTNARDINKELVWYNTTMAAIQYKVNREKSRLVEYGLDNTALTSNSTGGGSYNVTGWFAEKYIAINGKNNKLAKLILEQETADKKTLAIGETWDMGDGYTLTAQSIDAKASPRQAWLVLSKDGNKLDDKIIEAASTTGSGTQGVYTYYAKSLGGESNVPLFVTYVDSVFAGATSDMVQLKYTWLISSSVTEVKSGDKFGIFKVDSTSPLRLKSDNSITLSKNSKVDLAGNMKFKVADTDTGDVRFYPMVERTTPGIWEVRGTVANATALTGVSGVSWDATSFAGFWYDLKDNKQTESLQISAFANSRDINKEVLWYNTTMAAIQYKVNKEKSRLVEYGLDNTALTSNSTGGGYYNVTGWFAEKYIAINGKNNKLAKLILEQETADKKTLAIGETWDLGDGYTLTAQSIDAKASPRQAWLVLSKDGNKLDDKIIEAASTTGSGTQGVYTYYAKSLGGESNVPLFVTYVDSVFAGATSDMVQLKYTWLISSSVTEVKSGDKFGIFKVDSTSPLRLKSDNSVTLSKDSKVDLAGNMKFRVADTDTNDVRFYPMVEYEIKQEGDVTPTPTTVGTPKASPNVTAKPATTGTLVATEKPPEKATEKAETTPTATKTEPGFELAFAITGLLAVAYLVLRQRK